VIVPDQCLPLLREQKEYFLAGIINQRKYTRVAELGVRGGRTLLHLLAACPKTTVIGVDAWRHRPENTGKEGGETYHELKMPALEAKVRVRSRRFGDRCILHKMDTTQAATLIPDGSLDLVFIDADHTEAGVLADIDAYLPKIREGGVMSGHDINWPTVQRAVEQRFLTYATAPDNVWWAQC
jgi:predicted O-methyltransferase YrrM